MLVSGISGAVGRSGEFSMRFKARNPLRGPRNQIISTD
jgi:hypothetical protein